MTPQRSLFSFYGRGAAAAAMRTECSQKAEEGGPPQIRGCNQQLKASESRLVKECMSQQDLLERIQQKFVRKEKIVEQRKVESSVPANGLRVPALKRIREAEMSSTTPSPFNDPANEKRAKLLAYLGADDLSVKGVAWEAAKAKFEWMAPSKIRDAKGRRPGDPFYDARTLHIPDDVFRSLSASQKQYWSTKRHYMDIVLFFKVGKFYELYELDAEIGRKEFDWKLIISGVGKCRQVGCPESGIEDAIHKLVSRGYKVGRMEQIETGAQARANGGANSTVQRKLTEVITASTLMDGTIGPDAVHLLALKEEEQAKVISNTPGEARKRMVSIGFAFVDTAAGRFYVGSINDDSSRTTLLTLMTQVAPQEVLYEIGGISDETRRALRRSASPGLLPLVLTPLQPHAEFMEAADALRMFKSHNYFKDDTDADWCTKGSDPWPTALESIAERDLTISALGALAGHLSRMKCDGELLPNGVLSPYEVYKGSLRLDGQTVDNLELLRNRSNGGKEGTLLSYLDSCVTQFGKRLLRRWICHPLQNIGDIQNRLDAVEELSSCSEVSSSLRAGLRKLPDLERLVASLRSFAASPTLGLVPMAASKVLKRRLKTFFLTISGMRTASDLLLDLRDFSREIKPLKSTLLLSASKLPDSEAVQNCLKQMELSIDQSSKLPRLLCQLQDSEEDEEALEVEARMLSSLISRFNEQGFHWKKIIEILGQVDVLISFATAINGSTGPTCRPQFIASRGLKKGGSTLNIKGLWHPYAIGGQGGAFVPNDLELGNDSGSSVKPCALLLTGPNMGGKSTLLRATCLTVIIAQLGCFVPCESCTLSPVDIIFTRLGASDHIMTGESTFMVECTETASVLQHATSDSLVVLDELGRGTSTFDGYAIAYAVFHQLVNNLQCRLMFATHYHPLTEEFATNPLVSLGHMSCAFESSGRLSNAADLEDGESVLEKQLVFLYKLKEGACPKSYGLQVALLAGIPISVVKSAENAARVVHKRLSIKIGKNVESSDIEKDFVEAVLSAAKAATPVAKSFDDFEDDSYLNLLCLWQELRRDEKLLRQ